MPNTTPGGADAASWLAGVLACALPTWLAWNAPPSATFLNQALAFGLWGWFVLMVAAPAPLRQALQATRAVLAVLALCALAALWSWGPGALPASLALSLLGALGAAAALLLHGASVGAGAPARAQAVARIVFAGLLVAGLGGAVIGVIQVFQPELADGNWIAASTIPGRAVGNLRQPNHLSSVLLWACVALVALHAWQGWRVPTTAALGLLLVAAVVLTASRTGLLSVLLLAAWGALDRRLSRPLRWMLLAAPLAYAAAWWLLAAWGDASSHRFGGAARLAETDISGSRFAIWADTLALIRAHPWGGVGFGEFNLAWSMTVLPQRPIAFFDHTHNLPLQLAVELGLPLAAGLLVLLVAGLWRVARAAWRAEGDDGITLRCTLLALLMIGLHSLLEYPLWYAYFLLPTLWLWGLALGVAARTEVAPPAPPAVAPKRPRAGRFHVAVGLALVLATALAVLDYRRVVVIFSAPEGAAPLAERIAEGRRSVLFAHHAAYAAATTAGPDSTDLTPFASAGHYLLDTRLMTAWAETLYRAGRVDEARHVAARLREFRNPASTEFFEVCEQPATRTPWNCEPPRQRLEWRVFAR